MALALLVTVQAMAVLFVWAARRANVKRWDARWAAVLPALVVASVADSRPDRRRAERPEPEVLELAVAVLARPACPRRSASAARRWSPAAA